ncbi:MAG: sulfotransferase family 2 domain-containing protein [Gilvibacter sp.]
MRNNLLNRLNIKRYKNYQANKKFDNVIFIWIPKTAGTSLMATIEKQCLVQEYLEVDKIRRHFPNVGFSTFGHISIPSLLTDQIISKEYYNSSKTFCICRNPYDRFISLFHYSKKVNRIPEDTTMHQFVSLIKNGIHDIGLYNVKKLSQCNPQVAWVKDVRVDKVFKFEEIILDQNPVFDFLGLKREPLVHNNQSKERKTYQEELDKETISFIESFYHEDFDHFNYSKELSVE